MSSTILVSNSECESLLPVVVDFKQKRLTPSFAMYNGSIYFQLASVSFIASLDQEWRSLTDSEAVLGNILS